MIDPFGANRLEEDQINRSGIGYVSDVDTSVTARMKAIDVARAEEEGYSGFFEAFGESTYYNTLTGDLGRWIGSVMEHEDEEDFLVTGGMLERLAPDLSDYHDDLSSAGSRSELIYRMDHIREYQKHLGKLQNTSGGTAALITAGLIDPVYLGAVAATWGMAAPIGLGTKATQVGGTAIQLGRLSRTQGAIRGGLLSATADAPVEFLRAGISDTYSMEDIPLAIGSSAVFGGAIGARWPQLTVPGKYADDYTRRLVDQRTIALMETGDMSEGMARGLAEVWASRQGRLGYNKLGQKVYHDPQALSNEIVRSELLEAVQSGLARQTPDGYVALQGESLVPTTSTPNGYAVELERIDGEIELTVEQIKANVTAIRDRVNKLTGKKLDEVAEETGVIGREKGRTVQNIRDDIIEVETQVANELAEAEGTALQRQRDQLESTWIEDDASREIARNFQEETGESVDDALARVETYDPNKEDRTLLAKTVDFVSALPVIGQPTSQLLSSANLKVRRFATLVMEDGLRRNRMPLSTMSDWEIRKRVGAYYRKMDLLREKIRQEADLPTKTGWVGTVNSRILTALRSDQELEEGALKDTVTYLRSVFEEGRLRGIKEGTLDESIIANPHYFPRTPNSPYMRVLYDEALKRDGNTDAVTDFVANALISGSNNLSDRQAKILANRWIEMAINPMDYKSGRIANTKAWNALKNNLEQELVKDGVDGVKMDQSLFDEFMDVISPVKGNTSPVRMGKGRLQFDENYSQDGLTFSDLLSGNIDEAVERYERSIIGNVYWRKVVDNLAEEGEAAPGYTPDEVIAWMNSGQRKKLKSREEQSIKYAHAHMNSVPNVVMGKGEWNKVLRRAQDLGYIAKMSSGGFAQAVEFYQLIAFNGLHGVEAFGTAITNLKREMKGGVTGKGRLKHDLLSELEAAVGRGTTYLRRAHRSRMEDSMDFSGFAADAPRSEGAPSGGMFSQRKKESLKALASRSMEKMRAVTYTGAGAGIGPIDTVLSRAAMDSSLQHFVNLFWKISKKGGIGVFKEGHESGVVRRLRDLGLSDEDITKLIVQFKKPGTVKYGRNYRGARKVRQLSLDDWDDQALADRFSFALYRHCNKLVQRTGQGTIPVWLDNPVGRVIFQFKTFAIAASTEQLGYNLRRLDHQSLHYFAGSLAVGSLAYYAQTHLRALGMEESHKEEYLENALTNERIVASGFLRAGYTSVLPNWIDSIAHLVSPSGEGVFTGYGSYASGLGEGLIDGNPIGSMLNSGGQFAKSLIRNLTAGEPLTQQDLKKLKEIIPLQNMMFIHQALNRMIQNSGLPVRD